MANQFVTLASGITATGTGSSAGPDSYQGVKTWHGQITGSGSLSATILIQGSNNPAPTADGHWVTMGTITLSGSTAVSDGFASEAPWRNYRYNITAMSNATTTAFIWCGTNTK